jgi:DNA polymerase sigma
MTCFRKKAAKWNVETAFASPNPLEDDPTVSLTLFTEKEKLGMTNILDRIIQDNQNINSRDEAMKFYLDNIEIYGESMKMRRALQVPEKEIGTDPDEAEITKKAEQIVEGKLTGNAGARGPTLVPDDSEEPGEET